MANPATPINSEIKFQYGKPETFALRFVTGKSVQGNYGPRVLFSTTDDRKIWLNAEDGSDLERKLAEIGAKSSDFVTVTKIRQPKGGYYFTVERTDTDSTQAGTASEKVKTVPPSSDSSTQESTNSSPIPTRITPTGARMCAAFLVAIDAIAEAQACADRRGLKVTFTSEDVRACAISAFIQGDR